MKKLLCLMLVVMFAATLLRAQTAVVGRVCDVRDTAISLPYSAVMLYHAVDSTRMVRSAVADANGQFAIAGVEEGQYLLRVSSLGYAEQRVLVSLSGEQQHVDVKLCEVSQDIDEVVITSERTPTTMAQVVRPVTVIERNTLATMPQQALADVFEYIPSVDIRQRGVLGVQADLCIRGGTYDQNAVLINGINFTDPQTGHSSLSIPLDVDHVAQVEVVEGPAGRAVGANAMGGAVGFVTPRDADFNMTANALYGSHGLYKAALSAVGGNARAHGFVAASAMGSNGYIHNTDFNSKNLFARGTLNLGGAELNAQFGFADKAFGSNGFYSLSYPEQYEENQTWLGSVGVSAGRRLNVRANAYWRRLDDRYLLVRDNPSFYENYHLTDVLGGNLQLSLRSALGITALGTEWRNEGIVSTRLGDELAEPRAIRGIDSVRYNHAYSRTYATAFVDHTYQYGRLRLSGGGIMYVGVEPRAAARFYPGVDVSLQATGQLRLFASLSSAFRLPTFTDLFYKSPLNVGNRELRMEQAYIYEAGAAFATPMLSSKAKVFYRQGTDIIDWVRTADTALYTTMNMTTLNTLGYELGLTLRLASLTAPSSWFRLDRVAVGYAHISTTKQSGDYQSVYALDYLRHKATATLELTLLRRLSCAAMLVYQHRNGNYDAEDPVSHVVTAIPFGGFTTLDVRLAWRMAHFTPYVEATNLTNAKAFDYSGLMLPQRWFRVGVRWNFRK